MAQITLTRAQATQLVAAANTTKERTYFIAKDQGAYLGAGQKKDQVLFYFRGCDPSKGDDWYENASAMFGGDDFGEMLEIDVLEKLLKTKNIVSVTWKIGKTQIKLVGNPGKAKVEVKDLAAEAKEKERAEHFAKQVDHSPANKTIGALIESEKAVAKASAPVKTEDTEVAPKVKTKTIKEIACELLCEVETLSDEGRTIGLSYDTVLARVLEQRPGAKTSLNCLRWYAGKIRVLADGYFQYKLPQLRMRPVSGKQTPGEPALIVTDDA